MSTLPWVTWTLMATCAAVFLRLASLPDYRAAEIAAALAVVPPRLLASPTDPSELFTLASSAFLHAGWIHLLGNLLYLAVFGPAVEDRVGHLPFCGLYLTGGIAGALIYALTHASSTRPLMGASAAIAAVLGSHLVLCPHAQITTAIPIFIYFEVATLPAAFVIGFWFLLQVASLLVPVTPGLGPSTVAWLAHLVGFAAGSGIAFALRAAKPQVR